MKKITFPLKLRAKGPEVADLQDALKLLLDRAILLADNEAARRELSSALKPEREEELFGGTTLRLVNVFQKEHNIEASSTVDGTTADALNRLLDKLGVLGEEEPAYVAKGTVRFHDGFPASKIMVTAFDRDLRSEQLLGRGQTDRQGFYQIPYSDQQFLKWERGGADLVIKAIAADGSLLATSRILFNAPPVAEVDLVIPSEVLLPPTLFEKIGQAVKPLLEGLEVEELEEDRQHSDLRFLSGETGLQKELLARFVMAHKLARQGISPEFWFVLLGGSFYQFTEDQSLEEQLARVLDALPSLDATAVNKAFARGFGQKEIPVAFRSIVPRWIESFLKIIASRSLGVATKPSFARLALLHAGIRDAKKQETFARLFNEHKAMTLELREVLERDSSFKKEEVSDLQASFQLAEMVQGDFSVVKLIKEEFGIRRPEEIQRLAKESEEGWVELITARHASGEINLPFETKEVAGLAKLPDAEVYGKMIGRQLKEAFPTTAFAGELERALHNGSVHGLRRAEDVARFLVQHETFELLKTRIDEFLKRETNRDLRELAGDEDFRLQIKAVQRVFKLAPTFEATDTLLADDLHSAQKIYRLGESEFVRRYANRPGFTAKSARLAWNRAADTHAAVITFIADLKALEAEGLPKALKNGNELVSTFPNWNSLFKTGDLCECEHCRSVHSPAAYFADLLLFIKDRRAKDPTFTVKDVLFRRRPDLGYIELNCDNALTPYPYIDTVCEVLEDVVAAGENDIELSGFTAMPADAALANAEVAAAFAAQNLRLGANFSLSQVIESDPDLWVVHGTDATYLLKKKGTPDFFAEVLYNTKASAEELRAYPQYINPKAYDKLSTARYPITLPFDLFSEEVRAAFQKANLQRWDLMHALRGSSAPNNPTDGEIAAEYFGISRDASAAFDEMRLILTADATVGGQQAIWGETGANWISDVGNVLNFLKKTGLEYNELLVLLDLEFINPAGDIAILHTDPSCDTDKKAIQALDSARLDRIHRFLRLWRKLKGWKMWELDLVIRHPNIGKGTLDEAFLISLFYFSLLRERLSKKVAVEEVCALLGDLNTETRFTRLHEKREDALYQSLFLNRRLIQPLDTAFEIDPATNEIILPKDPVTNLPLPPELLQAHHPVIMAALGIREENLQLIMGLTRASDGTAYISDEMKLENLSFLWRHAWLSKQLKYRVEDWKTLLEILNMDLHSFASPKDAWEFLEKIDHLKATGFAPDELSWLLAADRMAKSAVKEIAATRFLAALRKELQAIRAENDPAQYDFLNATPPTDVNRLSALLTSLLQRLNRDEALAQFFIATLSDDVRQKKAVAGLPSEFAFPASITGAPNNIPIHYESTLRFSGTMSEAQRTVLITDPSLAAVTGLQAYQQAIQRLFEQPGQPVAVSLPTGFAFPATITGAPNNIPIRYETLLLFTGLMTDTMRTVLLTDPSLAAVTGIAAYQEAVEEFFMMPRLEMKFFKLEFAAPLADLPEVIDFRALSDAALALKVSYDAEQRLLRFAGIMSAEEKSALEALSADTGYRNAVNSLFTQPMAPFHSEMIWLQDSDLLFPLLNSSDPAGDHLAENLATAAIKALAYLSRTQSEGAVVQQCSTQLGLTESLTRRLLTYYALLPETLMAHFTGNFSVSAGVVDYSTLKSSFDGWFWVNRVAAILKKWKVSLEDLERMEVLTAGAQLLDFGTLPLDEAGGVASVDRLLRSSRLLRLRDRLPETEITLLEVLEKLNGGVYAGEAASTPGATEQLLFAEDVQRLNDVWLASDVQSIIASIDAPYPAGYLLAETWERLRRIFYFLDNLNGSAETVRSFASSAQSNEHATALKELLRSKLGTETWLALSAEIQDVLRERKRDALAAYLLTQPKPADAPSGKWENTNDLYAYYLLDVEMSACQLTSRLVQASGSLQLFVQRCFLGLEPEVVVKADGDDGDSAWRWWKWMQKYRVWEANRKVFLWPENWIEPELKKDRSQFFRDMENELLQNEVNQYTVETAFQNYLEKLDGVAQLEIAGFYQEDDGDNTIVHVFGRTSGAEPHLYYYRRYDYRQWTPWEKVQLDIQGDYLIPAVVNKRLFLFWPVFTEAPYEAGNSTVTVPKIELGKESTTQVDKVKKTLRMEMAVSEYRLGQWTPKKVSKDFDESNWYEVEITRKHYHFFPIDNSEIGGSFSIQYNGSSVGRNSKQNVAHLNGAFNVSGCKGVPELTMSLGNFTPAIRPELDSSGHDTVFMKWVELSSRLDSPENDFTLINYIPGNFDNLHQTPVLMQTPGIFKMTPPWHLSYLDRLLLNGLRAFGSGSGAVGTQASVARFTPMGTWLPFFYNDRRRTFFVLPSFLWGRGDRQTKVGGAARIYYPEIKKAFRQMEVYFEGLVQTWLDSFDPASLTTDQRQKMELFLQQQFPEEMFPYAVSPPYTDEQFKNLIKQWIMRYGHYYLGAISFHLFLFRQFYFKNHYHPFVCDFAKMVNDPLKGISALMSRETQLKNTGFSFRQTYRPTWWVVDPATEEFYPKEVVDFSPDGAYSPYNWELFFHAPLLIANSLSKNQRFEEARDWYHFIFNPLGLEGPTPGGSAMSKYWITKPFFETTDPQYIQQRIDNILRMLAGDADVPGFSAQMKADLEGAVSDWRTNPFEPHRIANYRTVAYQKTVVMKYLDNLIAWGDYLFRQDSMESINEATQLYILAAEVLGPRPKRVPHQVKIPLESFNELEDDLDSFSNALVQLENLVPLQPGNGLEGADPAPLPLLYFCIPWNDKMLGYWDSVADRLYKIRHCMNIEGVVRQLALFEPPIDPAALVKAIAGGIDISSAIADLNSPLPLYHFNILLQKANEVCSDVKALGSALLSALEKKDAEHLGLLRQGQEIELLDAMKAVKEDQIEEAKENLESIKTSKELTTIRRDYYRDIEKINASESLHQEKLHDALKAQVVSQSINISASVAHIVPSFDLGVSGFGGSPKASIMFGGPNVGSALQAAAGGSIIWGDIESYRANKASINAGHERRWDDWKLQERLANKELEQIDRSIAAAELRIAVVEKELENHNLQIENARETDEFMHSKYTNQELYQWQIGQISGVYFQSYKLAYDLAKRAERCFRFELGLQDSSYINFGYWDSLKKGLLSGEKLQYDLRRLETAYLQKNLREFELVKHVSLALLDPLALVKLRETGRCFFHLPEEILDLDYPGHYFRRIKSVSMTLPCVAGPYTTVSCTLRLLKNSIRIDTTNGDNGYPRNTDEQGLPADDSRFLENNIPVKAMAASNAQNDSGVFELSFRDERYLPFEGAGAISEWSLELFSDLPSNNPDPSAPDFGKPLRQFDYSTISDAIVHVKYTAREDAGVFKNSAVAHLRNYFSQDGAVPLLRLFSLRQEFPTQWHRFLNPADPADGNVFELEMLPGLFPLLDAGKILKINTIWLLARCTDEDDYSVDMTIPLPEASPEFLTLTLTSINQYGGLHFSAEDVEALGVEIVPTDTPAKWQLRMTRPGGGNLEVDPVKKVMEVGDLFLVLGYEWNELEP